MIPENITTNKNYQPGVNKSSKNFFKSLAY